MVRRLVWLGMVVAIGAVTMFLVLAGAMGGGDETAPTTSAGDPGCGSADGGATVDGQTTIALPTAGSVDAGCVSIGWDPGNIISDTVFYDSTAMTVDQVRTFIRSKGADCDGGFCLRELRLSTPAVPDDGYCHAYPGGTDVDAAQVIVDLSVACGINPQVMLVTLQKESQLVTRTDTVEADFAAAWGWNCPDTGPGGTANCDPSAAGFFHQAHGMARQWAQYRRDPDRYSYRAAHTVTILWNVAESGCGGAPVTIANAATASLYDYTPYQPNQASLDAYPGEGDRCSSYGNRNFFYLFRAWFGATGGGRTTAPPAGSTVAGTRVTLPDNADIDPAVRGKTIVAPTPAMARGIAAGLATVGMPYVYGGGTDGGGPDQGCARAAGQLNSCQGIIGLDCSGLTAYVLKQAGFAIPTYSGGQRDSGTSIPRSAGRPGDIIGYAGHVALYLGLIDGTAYLLEAPEPGRNIHVRAAYWSNEGQPADTDLHRWWTP